MALTLLFAAAAATFQPAPCNLEGVPPGFEAKQKVECGWVAVPRDQTSGKTIRLWTARVRAIGPAKLEDPILYINGGPGIATVDSIVPNLPSSKMTAQLRQDRDIIYFDQRGSGRSEESLCPDLGKTLNAIAGEGLAPDVEEQRNRAAFVACRAGLEKSGVDLEAYTTAAVVGDMEALRSAFGVARWNLLSVSYGSLVAMHAMRTAPDSIRSVILNSPFPPNSVTWGEQASSTAAAYQAIGRACAAQPACRDRFGDLVPKLEATLARLESEPVPDGEARINGRQFAKALWPLAVRSGTVRFVPLAVDRAHSGDADLIRRMTAMFAGGDAFGGFSPAQAYAIACHETGRTRDWYARARELYPALVSPAPDDSMDRMCAEYRPGFADPSFFAPVASDIPTLLYAGSLDPATPVVDAYQAMRFLPNATLVEIKDASHAPMGIDECTLGIATAFLRDPGTAPDTSCVAARTPAAFATDGLDEMLEPQS